MTPPLAVAAIIPAYNEVDRLEGALDVLCRSDCLREILVVDDGSTDATSAAALRAAQADARVRVLRLESNQGKQAAMRAGALAADAPCLLFLDADLVDLQPRHVRALTEPVAADRADMTLDLFKGGRWNTDLAHFLTPFLSGQRCLRADTFRQVMAGAGGRGYGVEMAITLAARRGGWRCQRVALDGVSHPSSEFHRGWLPGLARRGRMYAEIAATLLAGGNWRALLPRGQRLRPALTLRQALVLAIIGLAGGQAVSSTLASAPKRVSDLPLLPLAGAQRLLVVAAEFDNETLAAGGAIQAALSQGSQVHVPVLTRSDRPARQAEALAALEHLGAPPGSVTFLGYPSGGLETLWLESWATGCPQKMEYARRQGRSHPPNLNARAHHCGQDVLSDLARILTDYQPDLVPLPLPQASSAERRSASAFARLALALASEDDPQAAPQVWACQVRDSAFTQTQPPGRPLSNQLTPALPLVLDGEEWVRLDLTEEQAQRKSAALAAYTRQDELLGAYRYSFARQDELFLRLDILDAPAFTLEEAPLVGVLAWHSIEEPARDGARRLLLQGADLVELRVARVGDTLWVTAITRGPLIERLQYELLIKTPDGRTEIMRFPGQAERSGVNAVTAQWSPQQLGAPRVAAIAARVRQGAALDSTAWHLINLPELPAPTDP